MKSYCIPQSKVIYEILNNEVIAIDFKTGNYYALTCLAKQIWQMVEKQICLEKMTQVIADHYDREQKQVSKDVESFLNQLVEIGLLELDTKISHDETSDKIFQINFEQDTYEAPTVQEYTDVQNLLLLDPIHEVTDSGWPHKL